MTPLFPIDGIAASFNSRVKTGTILNTSRISLSLPPATMLAECIALGWVCYFLLCQRFLPLLVGHGMLLGTPRWRCAPLTIAPSHVTCSLPARESSICAAVAAGVRPRCQCNGRFYSTCAHMAGHWARPPSSTYSHSI